MAWNLFTNTGSQKTSGTVTAGVSTIASASSIAITNNAIHFITGTTGISTMTGGVLGGIVRLVASGQATGVCVVLNNAATSNALSLRDSANFGIYAGESVTFVYNGTYWVEVNRDVKTVLDYVQATSNTNITATTEATATTIMSSSTVTFDGATVIDVEAFSPLVSRGTSWIKGALYDSIAGAGASSIGFFASSNGPSTDAVTTWKRRYTPTAATHLWSMRSWVDAGTGIVYAGAGGSGANMPAYIKISRAL